MAIDGSNPGLDATIFMAAAGATSPEDRQRGYIFRAGEGNNFGALVITNFSAIRSMNEMVAGTREIPGTSERAVVVRTIIEMKDGTSFRAESRAGEILVRQRTTEPLNAKQNSPQESAHLAANISTSLADQIKQDHEMMTATAMFFPAATHTTPSYKKTADGSLIQITQPEEITGLWDITPYNAGKTATVIQFRDNALFIVPGEDIGQVLTRVNIFSERAFDPPLPPYRKDYLLDVLNFEKARIEAKQHAAEPPTQAAHAPQPEKGDGFHNLWGFWNRTPG